MADHGATLLYGALVKMSVEGVFRVTWSELATWSGQTNVCKAVYRRVLEQFDHLSDEKPRDERPQIGFIDRGPWVWLLRLEPGFRPPTDRSKMAPIRLVRDLAFPDD